MSARYEIWLLDDTGKRVSQIKGESFFSYTRNVVGFSTFQIGMPLKLAPSPLFEVDWRFEVWRSPGKGLQFRREGTWLARRYEVYTRTDGVQMIVYYGRDPKDLLNRRFVIQAAGTTYTSKTDYIDDMMKEIVREQALYGSARDEDGTLDNTRAYPQDEFTVQPDNSLGPEVRKSFFGRNVYDIVRELSELSMQLNSENPYSRRIYFDVVAVDIPASQRDFILTEDEEIIYTEDGEGLLTESSVIAQGSRQGFEFQTFVDRRGRDRTAVVSTEVAYIEDVDGVPIEYVADGSGFLDASSVLLTSVVDASQSRYTPFSVESGTLEQPRYQLSHIDEVNTAIVKGQGRGESRASVIVSDVTRQNLSRWNRVEGLREASGETSEAGLESIAQEELRSGRPEEEIIANILDTPNSRYGVDWDMGDVLAIAYAGKQFSVEVRIVYVSVDDTGTESISGRNDVAV